VKIEQNQNLKLLKLLLFDQIKMNELADLGKSRGAYRVLVGKREG
jgi:hypothetical protein